ncbi:MAG: hypothetical protein K5841_00570, partial [Fretibacterium sp.]|nr:hypothetical protein [Fretibacterium sp.]
ERTRQLAQLRAAGGYGYLIEMDGGINLDNAARIALAGCDVAVAGSAVFSSPAPAEYLDEMKLKVREALSNAGFRAGK